MNKISIKAVILATLLVFALDIVCGIVLVGIMGISAITPEMGEEQIAETILATTTSMPFLLSSLILGTLTTLLGGYVAARIAKKEAYWNAGAIGVIGVILGIITAGEYPLWFSLLGDLMMVAAALLGGHLAKSRIEEIPTPAQ